MNEKTRAGIADLQGRDPGFADKMGDYVRHGQSLAEFHQWMLEESIYFLPRGDDEIVVDRIYLHEGTFQVSPDGVGFYYYDTLAEAKENHR